MSPSPTPMPPVVGRVLSRIYDLPVEDPIEVIADYDPCLPDGGELLSKAHDSIGGPGLTISVHGSGSVWLDWNDVPVLIAALQTALRDVPPSTVLDGSMQPKQGIDGAARPQQDDQREAP